MNGGDFFNTVPVDDWHFRGLDPWTTESVFNAELVERLRFKPESGVSDVDAAYGLARLAHRELLAYGNGGGQILDDDQIALVLRSTRSTLRRLDIPFDPPFRDFRGFHGYWSKEGMSGGGGWGARRGYLNDLFSPIFSALDEREETQARQQSMRGVDGQVKNIIFASTGFKPEIVLIDAVSNTIKIQKHEESCLVYDRALGDVGLTWRNLVDWWKQKSGQQSQEDLDTSRLLYKRLAQSLASPPERILFKTYCQRYAQADGSNLPALLPQVYLHYDPYTRRTRGAGGIIKRERMDFLLLMPGRVRIVLEVDGQQHYSRDGKPSPRLYSEMVAEDRKLRLAGYDVYRFGGHELSMGGAEAVLREFFDELLSKHLE